MIKLSVKCCLLLCLLIALSCGSSGGNNEDRFMQINFDSGYTMTHKEFTFSGGVSASDSGDNCAAVTWEGSLNKTDYYGFAVGKDDFHLILYFPKRDGTFGTKILRAGEYTAVMRYGDEIYKNPQSDITLDIAPAGSDGNTKITITGSLDFVLPVPITVTASNPMILRPY